LDYTDGIAALFKKKFPRKHVYGLAIRHIHLRVMVIWLMETMKIQ